MPDLEYTPSEIANRGKDLYERDIRAEVELGNFGKMLALDVRSGAYELGDDSLTALNRLTAKKPDAQVYMMRVGYPTAAQIGKQTNHS
jgi:hypothetical protein